MGRQRFEVVEERSGRTSGRDGGAQQERVARLVALGRALSDPIRVRMLGMMGEGRGCCDLPDLGVPAGENENPEADTVHRHPRVLRPHNFPEGVMGKGVATLEIGGEQASVLNLGSKTAAMPRALPPYESWLGVGLRGTVVVDFHGDSAWEKMEFATAVDGRVAAVLGTHTHEPTINLHLLPWGTALVVDVGMTGPSGSPGGFPLEHFAARMRGEDPASLPPFELAKGRMTLGAVLLRIEGGKTVHIERIS